MNIATKTAEQVSGRVMLKFLSIAGLLVLLPFLIHIQWLTGPIVNALLILMLFLVGKREAFIACFIPSLAALAGGLLPYVVAPYVPLIMIGNLLYVIAIDEANTRVKEEAKGYWYGVLAGSLAKFAFLFVSFLAISSLVLKGQLAVFVAQMMSWAQLYTALLGGIIAWVILKWMRRI